MEKVTIRELNPGIQLQLQVKLNKNLCTMKKQNAPPPPPGLGNKTTITNLFWGNSKTYRPLGAVDDLMHYRKASGDSASGSPQHLGAIVFTVA